MDLFERIKQDVLNTGANVFKIVLVKDGTWQEETLRPSCPALNCYSLSKNFTATGIGVAQDLGLLSVEDPIVNFFPDELPERMDDRLPRVKIKHLLTQTMGIAEGYLFEDDRFTHGTDDWARLVLSRPLEHEPGTKFAYSNSTFYLLSCIVHRTSCMTMELFLKRHLLGPMGIHAFAWESCPKGETMGATGLYMSTQDVAKLGVLYLNNGEYEGRRLLSSEFIEEAAKPFCGDPAGPKYGYSFWVNDIGYNGAGAACQTLVVVPEQKLVFAAHAYAQSCDYVAIVRNNLQ